MGQAQMGQARTGLAPTRLTTAPPQQHTPAPLLIPRQYPRPGRSTLGCPRAAPTWGKRPLPNSILMPNLPLTHPAPFPQRL
eukprot:scaffold56320_cov23-Tisochrysis_lutea.AAC.1